MVINSIVSSASLQAKPNPTAKPAPQTPSASPDTASGLNVSLTPATFPAGAPDISSAEEAQQSVDFAMNSILSQSASAILAHGRHHSQTVIDLLAH